jgi:invasion protein IalB
MSTLNTTLATCALVVLAATPAAAAPGTRHITQQFQSWTLACNEIVGTKTKTCSVAQDIFGPGGALAFHWELTDAPGDRTRATLMLAPLLSNSVIVLRAGGTNVVIDTVKCAQTGCTGSTMLPAQSLNALSAGINVTAQFIYMNATGSVIGLPAAGFHDAWMAMRQEVPSQEMMTGTIAPRHGLSVSEKVAAESRFH